MAYTINEQDRQAISEAIKTVERRCNAEIVTVISQRSDDYLFIPILWAALGALFVPALTMGLGLALPQIQLYGLQLLVFLILVLVGRFEPLAVAMIPASVKRERASKAAGNHFMTLQLHTTKNRASVMLFVSEAERYVRIITDVEVAKKIPDSAWEEVVQAFITRVKADEITTGYLEAIEKSGELLRPHFPRDVHDEDELPNHLIVL